MQTRTGTDELVNFLDCGVRGLYHNDYPSLAVSLLVLIILATTGFVVHLATNEHTVLANSKFHVGFHSTNGPPMRINDKRFVLPSLSYVSLALLP